MPQTTERWTAEMVRALPEDGLRHEVVDGIHLVTPAPRLVHQRLVQLLGELFTPYVRAHNLGEVWYVPADVEMDPHTLVMPDVFVAPERVNTWRDLGAPRLIIEVLSPSSARADHHLKRRRYLRAGVPEYWIVDLDARLVERWRPEETRPEILSDAIAWQPDRDAPPLTLELPDLFARALGEA